VAKAVSHAWRELINAYLGESEALRLMFLLLDARRTPGDHDKQMHDWTTAAGIDERIVLTKSDKLSKNELIKNKTAIARELEVPTLEMIPWSAVTKQGIDEVRREIAARL
jgi:GTP-binding protein